MSQISNFKLSDLIKKISLREGVVEEDVEGIVSEYFLMIRDSLKDPTLNKILINNFGSFIPSIKSMHIKKKALETLIATGRGTEKVVKCLELINNNIDKQFKHKRKCTT